MQVEQLHRQCFYKYPRLCPLPERGGGVCAFVTRGVPCKRRNDLHPAFECMWLWLRPHRLPRPHSGIICRTAYFPEAQAQENRDRVSYLIETLDSVRSAHPQWGVIICGDCYTEHFSDILIDYHLNQVVRDPTRGNSILDHILRDLYNRYDKAVVSANLGTSRSPSPRAFLFPIGSLPQHSSRWCYF